MSSAVSFICEHTAEYILVPRVCDALRTRFPYVTPFFYWASREGSAQGRSCGPPGAVRVISIFRETPQVAEGRPRQDRGAPERGTP